MTNESGHIVAVIPAFNEATQIGGVVRGAQRFVSRVIVVDDGSEDATAEVAAQAGALLVRHSQTCGPGAATMTGIEAARRLGARLLITIDGDGQHDSADIPALLRPLEEGWADVVFANRFGGRNAIPWIRRGFNFLGNVVTFITAHVWLRDSQCGFKAFGSKALWEIDLRMHGFEFCTEIVREAVQRRWRIAIIPTKVMYSEYTLAKGQSFAHGVRTALRILLRSILR
jgi:glycosyltransferase involved in cell wall biosynthesis